MIWRMMKRILIVEGDAAFADYLRRGLTYEGCHVCVAATAEEGLAGLCSLQPQVVILDVMLPGMDGLTACRALGDTGYAGPVLMLTARGGIDDRVVGLDSGADDYLAKPCEFDELLACLRTVSRRCPDKNVNAALAAGDISLDPARFVFCWGGGSLLSRTSNSTYLRPSCARPPACAHAPNGSPQCGVLITWAMIR